MLVAREVEKGELVSLGGCFLLAEFEAEFLIEGDAGFGVGDPDAGVKKFDHALF